MAASSATASARIDAEDAEKGFRIAPDQERTVSELNRACSSTTRSRDPARALMSVWFATTP
jgi:hypothetical protein